MTDYTNSDVKKGQLKIASGSEDYTVNLTVQATVDAGKSVSGDGIINLSGFNDTINYSATGNAVINLGDGNDTFNQTNPSQPFVDITGGQGNDTYFLLGAHANFNYFFSPSGSSITSTEGNDVIGGLRGGSQAAFHPGYDTITLHTGGLVNPGNFNTYFDVTNSQQGTLITTDNPNDNFSIQIVGVHLSANELIAQGAFIFA